MKPRLSELILLDGDQIRAAFGHDLDYHEKDRVTQVKRLQNMARLLSEQGLVVVVAVLYANKELLCWNRQHLRNYFEIYLEASLKTLRQRDWKGLYAKADAGEMSHVVGLDIPWYAPQNPDMIINTDTWEDPEIMARRVAGMIPFFSRVLEPESA